MKSTAVFRLSVLLIASVLLLCFAESWRAQQPLHYVINDEDGLPSNEVYQVVQDSFGYVWIGCDAGLFRYDGNEYKYYTTSIQNGRSISGIQIDVKGSVWCKNFNGQIFRVEGDSLRVICDLTGRVSSSFAYAVDANCHLFAGLQNTIVEFNSQGDSIASYDIGNNDVNRIQPVQDVACLNSYVYFFVPTLGIYRLDPAQGTILSVDTSVSVSNSYFSIMFFQSKDELHFIRTDNKSQQVSLGKIQGSTLRYYHDYESRENTFRVHAVCSDLKNNIWLCTSDGAYKFDSTVHAFNAFNAIHRGEKVSWMLNDRENLYWFTTLNNGIFVSPSLDLRTINPSNSVLAEKQITALTLINGSYFLAGTYSGYVYKVDPLNDSVYQVNGSDDQKHYTVKKITDAGDDFLLSRGSMQLVKKNTEALTLLPVTHARDMLIANDSIYFILPDAFAAVSNNNPGPTSQLKVLRKTGGRSTVHNESDHLLYVAFNDGVFTYEHGVFTDVQNEGRPIFANSLSYSSGITWVASVTEGVIGLQNGKVVRHYSTSNGLNETDVRALFTAHDTVIACTNERLYTIITSTGVISSYNITSGINPKDITAISMFRHEIWLATNKGLQHFPFSMTSVNSVAPGITITSIEAEGSQTASGNKIILPYENNTLKISFSSAAFRSKGKAHFEYRIIGMDTSWTELSWANRSVTLKGLAPGEYEFVVRAVNESDVHSENPATFSFSVKAPVWQAWWFYLLSSVLAIGAVSGIAVLRLRVLRRRAEMKNKMTLSQLTALKAQMNPHFMYNALNSIQDLVLQHDVKNSTLYLGKFSKLMRSVLDASGKEQITLNNEIEILELYLELEKLRMGNDFTYSITVEDAIDRESEIPPMIIQPFVENALKHGLLHRKGAKNLSIAFRFDGQLVCSVRDNGVGRAKSAEIRKRLVEKHASFATSATEKRIELLNEYTDKEYSVVISDLHNDSVPSGTSVVIRIPLFLD